MTDQLREFSDRLVAPQPLLPREGHLNIAVVLDEFSTACFRSDANLWPVDPRRPAIDLDYVKFDFLLVESAWAGNSGKWRYMVTSDSGPKPPLVKLIDAFKRRGIPTVFWNKEDPPHFGEFISTAKHFDIVLTSDAAMIPEYESAVPNAQVDLLRFAASPSLHNPSQVDDYRGGDIAFAGQYFAHKFPERRQQMELLFPEAAKYKFAIFSRALGGDPRYQFPEPFDQYVVGSLPYSEMLKEYRRHRVFLNVNSVVDSKTMCARRVFELTAAKTAVVGTESAAVRSVYDASEVELSSERIEIGEIFQRLLGDDNHRREVTQRAWRKTLSAHTYRHRIEQINALLGNSAPSRALHVHLLLDNLGSAGKVADLLAEINDQQFSIEPIVEFTYELVGDTTNLGFDLPNRNGLLNRPLSDYMGTKPTHLAYVNGDYALGPWYFNDLLLSARQQDADLVAKVLPSAQTLEAVEERTTDRSPEHGWLYKIPETTDLSEVVDPTANNWWARIIDGIPTYQSDVFDIRNRV